MPTTVDQLINHFVTKRVTAAQALNAAEVRVQNAQTYKDMVDELSTSARATRVAALKESSCVLCGDFSG